VFLHFELGEADRFVLMKTNVEVVVLRAWCDDHFFR